MSEHTTEQHRAVEMQNVMRLWAQDFVCRESADMALAWSPDGEISCAGYFDF